MRSLIASLALLLFTIPAVAAAGGTRTVEGDATGKHWVEFLNRWKTVPISVYVDEPGNVYISSRDGGIIKARGFLTSSDSRKVVALLKKSQQWVKTAKAEQLEITKPLGSFMRDSGHSENGISLRFFAASKGTQTDVILHIADFDNMFYKLDLYLEPQQVVALIRLLERVPVTLAELKRQNSAAAMLR